MDNKAQLLVLIGVNVWVSFLSAGFAAMLFFATFDPSAIAEVATFPMQLSRSAGYSLGFLLFWMLLMANSAAVLWLSQRKPSSV